MQRGRGLTSVAQGLGRHPAAPVLVGTAVGYAVGAELSWGAFGATLGLAFFPPAGITFAALAVAPRRWWPALLATVAVVEVLVDRAHGLGWARAAGFALANTLEPAVGVTVALRLADRQGLRHLDEARNMRAFVLGGLLAGPVAASLVGATVQNAAVPTASWWVSAFGFLAGDALGVLVVATPLLLASRERWRRLASRPVEAPLNIAVTAAISIAVFWFTSVPVMYVVLLPLAWAAFRMDALKLAVDGVVVAAVANVATAQGRGPFAAVVDVSVEARLALAKLFLGTALLIAWLFLVGASERDRIRETAVRGDAEHAALDLLRSSVLPADVVEVPGARVEARYHPAHELYALGGDWYDVIERPDRELVLVIGDVVGGGLTGGLVMAQLRSAVRAAATAGSDPAKVLSDIDRFIDGVPSAFGATAVCARLCLRSGQVELALAGHPPPIVRQADGRASIVTVRPGPPLGVHAARAAGRLLLGPDDALVLYTDGLVERRDEPIDRGIATLTALVASADVDDAAWLDAVIRTCLDGHARRDDVAVMVCQRRAVAV